MRGQVFLFDVPVYRLAEDEYYKQREAYVLEHLATAGARSSEAQSAFRSHLEESYGGPWDYNEIVGYIQLHFLGSQIRGEYFSVDAKRIVKTRCKTFVFRAHKLAPEIQIPRDATSNEICQLVNQYLDKCAEELPRRYIDSSLLDSMAPYVDWRRMWLQALD
jgi:hypothetical protein